MKSLVLISILLVILGSEVNVDAMTVSGGMYRDPDHPGMCKIDNNMILKAGEVQKNPNGECAEWFCYENGHAIKRTCMKNGMRPGCIEGESLNPSANYPSCCGREIKCKTDYFSEYPPSK